jgi:hypothetical protein
MHFYMHSNLHKKFYSCKKWVLHVPLAGGGAKPATAGEDKCTAANGRSARFDGPPSEDFL